jgi:hypothetical protein
MIVQMVHRMEASVTMRLGDRFIGHEAGRAGIPRPLSPRVAAPKRPRPREAAWRVPASRGELAAPGEGEKSGAPGLAQQLQRSTPTRSVSRSAEARLSYEASRRQARRGVRVFLPIMGIPFTQVPRLEDCRGWTR